MFYFCPDFEFRTCGGARTQLRIRIRIVYFGIICYAVYMYMGKKYICSNTFLETELWLTAAGIRIPCIT